MVAVKAALGGVVAKCRLDLISTILRQFLPGDQQQLIVGNLKDSLGSENRRRIVRLQTPFLSFQAR